MSNSQEISGTPSGKNLQEFSIPPTREQLQQLQANPSSIIPNKYTRDITRRIFVNRSINMEYIKYVGFDMDYTLAIYKTPEYEKLVYNLVVQKLIKKGYPSEISNFQYDSTFPIRGLFLDKKLGYLLKVDYFGYILRCVKGRTVINNTRDIYPDKIVHPEEIGSRFFFIDSLFGLPEACLYADLVQYFEEKKITISYQSLFEDVRQAVHTSHIGDDLKPLVVKDLEKYIVNTGDKLALLLNRLRDQNRKTFLLTNSEYEYTNKVMSYLLDGIQEGKKWNDYFDIVITNASKPKFFESGTTLREVDPETECLKFTDLAVNHFEPGKIYAGGSLKVFKQFTGTSGSEVLYVGDNIFSDIIFSKKTRCLWRTLLIVRELEDDINIWMTNINKWNYLGNLEYLRAKTYANYDSSSLAGPEAKDLKDKIKECAKQWDDQFNIYFGSTFRSGTSESFFSYNLQRFADLYTSDYLHLLYYPFFYYYSSLSKLLPHETQLLFYVEKKKLEKKDGNNDVNGVKENKSL